MRLTRIATLLLVVSLVNGAVLPRVPVTTPPYDAEHPDAHDPSESVGQAGDKKEGIDLVDEHQSPNIVFSKDSDNGKDETVGAVLSVSSSSSQGIVSTQSKGSQTQSGISAQPNPNEPQQNLTQETDNTLKTASNIIDAQENSKDPSKEEIDDGQEGTDISVQDAKSSSKKDNKSVKTGADILAHVTTNGDPASVPKSNDDPDKQDRNSEADEKAKSVSPSDAQMAKSDKDGITTNLESTNGTSKIVNSSSAQTGGENSEKTNKNTEETPQKVTTAKIGDLIIDASKVPDNKAANLNDTTSSDPKADTGDDGKGKIHEIQTPTENASDHENKPTGTEDDTEGNNKTKESVNGVGDDSSKLQTVKDSDEDRDAAEKNGTDSDDGKDQNSNDVDPDEESKPVDEKTKETGTNEDAGKEDETANKPGTKDVSHTAQDSDSGNDKGSNGLDKDSKPVNEQPEETGTNQDTKTGDAPVNADTHTDQDPDDGKNVESNPVEPEKDPEPVDEKAKETGNNEDTEKTDKTAGTDAGDAPNSEDDKSDNNSDPVEDNVPVTENDDYTDKVEGMLDTVTDGETKIDLSDDYSEDDGPVYEKDEENDSMVVAGGDVGFGNNEDDDDDDEVYVSENMDAAYDAVDREPKQGTGSIVNMGITESEDEPGSSFFTFILIVMFATAICYLLYHNKRKVMGYLRPSNQRKTGSRFRGKYDRLESQPDGKTYRF